MVQPRVQSVEFFQQVQRQGGTREIDTQITLQAQGAAYPADTAPTPLA